MRGQEFAIFALIQKRVCVCRGWHRTVRTSAKYDVPIICQAVLSLSMAYVKGNKFLPNTSVLVCGDTVDQ